ncbi:hypothetical protein FH972_023907 [Carpinus fangiana]|uniref:Peptidase S8/S53 domain-containing protein n=1 Tax=Carpinus fangiana TaxID=176857 RepID=A0A5N6KWJ7_9ROSI|nr:hypothetical protein FH972_023907 [Carpinus fangiana]
MVHLKQGRLLPSLLCLLLSVEAVLAVPSLYPRDSTTTTPSTHASDGDEYVVILSKNPDTPRDLHTEAVLAKLDLSPSHPDVRLVYNNSAFHGFAASMKSHCLGLLNDMTDVSHVEKTTSIKSHLYLPPSEAFSSAPPPANKARAAAANVRHPTTWGLQRLSSAQPVIGPAKDVTYTYTTAGDTTPDAAGAGVDVYVVDTGIYTEHAIFNGRARMGFSFEQDASDRDGHGTHVSGTIAGAIFGVSSSANLIGVKVLGDDGTGNTADSIYAMQYVVNEHDRRKSEANFVGSVMSMSWGLSVNSAAINTAVNAAAAAGVHVSIASGNSADDACKHSPASAGGAASSSVVTVGSINIGNEVSGFSNTGSCVDIYAPGEDVLSSWIQTPFTVNYLSGTSMACPHVSGVMAYLIAENPILGQDPAGLKQKLLSIALRGAISNDPNALLLSNGITASGPTNKRAIVNKAVETEKRQSDNEDHLAELMGFSVVASSADARY